jgi:hypothetical protein
MGSSASGRSGRPRARRVPPGTTGRSPNASCRRWDLVGVEETRVLFDAGRRLAADAAVFGRERL